MIFCFTTLNAYQETRPFYYQFNELENGLEFLNYIVLQGDTLLSVYLIEDGQRIILPVDAFDGFSFLSVLKQLELEWKDLLSKPLQADMHVVYLEESSNWYKAKLSDCEQRITSLELMIDDITNHSKRGSNLPMSRDDIVVARYNSLLERYRAQLNQTYSMRDSLLARLYPSQLDY